MRYIIFLFLLITSTCFSQKRYSFDFLIEYEFNSIKDSLSNKEVLYLTNSKDNSYFAKIESMDTLYFDLEFVDQDKVWAETKVSKEDFFMAEGINLTCDYNLSYRNDFKFRTKEYEFELLPDTILNNKSLRQYKLKYIGKRKRKKSFPVGSNTYIIKDSTAFHLPILTHSTAFEEWEINKKIPNGIFSEKIFYDYQNNIEYKFILKNCYKIKKSIIVPEDCLEQ